MDNENKELQNNPSEAELEEKVLQDVSEKIRDAAAELEDEIAEAEATAEETEGEADVEELTEIEEQEPVIVGYDEEGNPIYAEAEAVEPVIVGYDEEGNPIYGEAEVEEVKEPKWVSLKLRNLVLSLVGAALVGAILLFAGLKVPTWVETAGSSVVPATPLFQSGKTVVKVAGETITDKDMERIIYNAAVEYINQSGGVVSDPAEFDWSTEVKDGKTAEDVVKENAVKTAVEKILLMKAGKENGVAWDEDMETAMVDMELANLNKTYGEELVELNVLAQGFGDVEQFKQGAVRDSYAQAVAEDMTANPDAYYPDQETLVEFASTDGVSVKHILIAHAKDAAPAEGEEVAEDAEAPADKKALAEDVLKRVQSGEDFDALVKEFNEDPGMTDAGYVVTESTNFVPEFKEAALALGMNEISGIVETEHGYHIIKRIPGEIDLFNYWRANAKIKISEKKLAKMSVADIVAKVAASQEEFGKLYQEYQAKNPTTGAGY